MAPSQSPLPSPRLEAFAHWCYKRVEAVNNFRYSNRKTFHALVWFPAFSIAFLLWLKTGDWVLSKLHLDKHSQIAEIFGLALHELLVTFIGVIAVSAVVGLVPIARRAMATKALGITWASIKQGEILELLRWCVDHLPRTETVHVICISGLGLFGNESEGKDLPLRERALRGRLEVIMPSPSADNPTVLQRWSQYSDPVKRASYPDIDVLVNEIKRGRDFLIAHGNRVIEHNILCMWRVVLLSDYCLVQNYFPNLDGSISEHAPTFVYANAGDYSCYQTFAEMFRLVAMFEEKRARE